MTVYADILFLTNFVMDCLLLGLAGLFCSMRPKKVRLVFAGVLGGAYGTLYFLPALSVFYLPAVRLLFGGLLCAMAYCPCRIGRFFRLWGVFLAMGALAGGIFYAVAFYTGAPYLSTVQFIAGAIVLWFGASRGVRFLRRRAGQEIHQVEIFYAGRSVKTDGLTDTGNTLKDPIRNLPVLLADGRLLEKLFSPDCNVYNLAEWVQSTDLCWIPYRSVETEGVFCGFLADSVVVDGRDLGRTAVACCGQRLDYGVLLQHEIILEGV